MPTRPLAARAEPLGPEPVERQFAPQVHRQPAPAPLPRPAQPQLGELQPDDRGVGQHPLAAVFREQRQGARRRRSFLEDGDRLAPSQFLRIVDLAQVQQRPLHHTASAYPAILHDAPVTVLFAVLLALGVTEKHDAAHDTRSKIGNPAANRPSQANTTGYLPTPTRPCRVMGRDRGQRKRKVWQNGTSKFFASITVTPLRSTLVSASPPDARKADAGRDQQRWLVMSSGTGN